MRAANRAHASTAQSNGQASSLLVRFFVAVIATLALLLIWRPTLLHAQETAASSKESPAKPHVVKPGETLWSLAARYYGDGRQWQNLARLNGIPISEEPPLKVGMRLSVPASPTVRGAKAAEVAAAPADSTVPKAALAKAGEGTLPAPESAPSRAPAGSLAAQTRGKSNAGSAGKSAGATAVSALSAEARSDPAAAAVPDTSKADLAPSVGTIIGGGSLFGRLGLVEQDDQANSRKASEVLTVFHRDLPNAAEAERRTRAVLRPNTPVPRTAEFESAPFIMSERALLTLGRVSTRVGASETSGESYPQRAIKTDEIELQPPANGRYSVGDRFMTFRTPALFEKGRVIVYPTGIVEVIKAEGGKPALAIVQRQSGRIEQGQGLLPAPLVTASWVQALKLDAPDVSTTVTWLDAQEVMPTLQSFVLVGAGTAQGLKAGDEMAVYGRAAKGSSEALVATVRVVRAERDHAATVITRQYQTEISLGMIARRYAKAP